MPALFTSSDSGVERSLPLPVSLLSKVFGQDAQGNLYICGGNLTQQGKRL